MPKTNKPLIGVISCNRIVEGEEAYTVKRRYVDAVARYADAVPVIVPSLGDANAAAALLDRLDAILLTGSNSNIEPKRYGAASGRAPFDPNRDGTATALILAATQTNKPVFGVCRGLQEINVALGGTLRDQRDNDSETLQHHAPDGVDVDTMFSHAHGVRAKADTPLAKVVGTAPFTINSVHFQAIDRLGDGLLVNAEAEDGVIEAISSRPGAAPILAVQWHPEWRPDGRTHDLAFWREVGRVARGAAA